MNEDGGSPESLLPGLPGGIVGGRGFRPGARVAAGPAGQLGRRGPCPCGLPSTSGQVSLREAGTRGSVQGCSTAFSKARRLIAISEKAAVLGLPKLFRGSGAETSGDRPRRALGKPWVQRSRAVSETQAAKKTVGCLAQEHVEQLWTPGPHVGASFAPALFRSGGVAREGWDRLHL